MCLLEQELIQNKKNNFLKLEFDNTALLKCYFIIYLCVKNFIIIVKSLTFVFSYFWFSSILTILFVLNFRKEFYEIYMSKKKICTPTENE